jgi:hypothetical protein
LPLTEREITSRAFIEFLRIRVSAKAAETVQKLVKILTEDAVHINVAESTKVLNDEEKSVRVNANLTRSSGNSSSDNKPTLDRIERTSLNGDTDRNLTGLTENDIGLTQDLRELKEGAEVVVLRSSDDSKSRDNIDRNQDNISAPNSGSKSGIIAMAAKATTFATSGRKNGTSNNSGNNSSNKDAGSMSLNASGNNDVDTAAAAKKKAVVVIVRFKESAAMQFVSTHLTLERNPAAQAIADRADLTKRIAEVREKIELRCLLRHLNLTK